MHSDSLVVADVVHPVLVAAVHLHNRLHLFRGVATRAGLRLNDNLILQRRAKTKREKEKEKRGIEISRESTLSHKKFTPTSGTNHSEKIDLGSSLQR